MRRVAFAVLSTVAGLVGLLSFKTHSASPSSPAALSTTAGGTSAGGTSDGGTSDGGTSDGTGTSPAGATTGTSPSGTPASTGSGTGSASRSTSASTSSRTVTGDAADTRYGPVQVQITVRNGALSAISVVEYPDNDPRDAEINGYAIPVLNKEALAAGSARIDTVSGATYTSQGYLESLQSALDKAGL